MPLTTAQAMTQFLVAITATAAQNGDVSSKVTTTRNLLNAAFPSTSDLPVSRTIMIGSADRGTMIRPVNDPDVMAQFSNKDQVFERYRHDSGALLQRVRNALNAKTTVRQVGVRGQAVRLFYQSGAHVDNAPVFKWSTSGYALPSGSGGWITTDPEAQAVWYSGRKVVVGQSHLTPLVKIVKRWNKVHSNRFSSYHLEVMVASMFGSIGANYRNAVRCFFEWAPNHIGVSDPAGYYGRLDDYLTQTVRNDTSSRLAGALKRANDALAAEAAGKLHAHGGKFSGGGANPAGATVTSNTTHKAFFFYVRNPSVGRPFIEANGHHLTMVEGQETHMVVAGGLIAFHRRGDIGGRKQFIIEILRMPPA